MSWVGLFIGSTRPENIVSLGLTASRLNHFFLPIHAGVSLPHTIKSVVFLLDVLDGVCGKRYIKSASIEQYYRCIA